MGDKKRILFVCLGNIVRSPLAEHLFRRLAEQAGMADQVVVASAGTSPYHVGDLPDGRMRAVAAAHGWSYTGESRKFSIRDFDRYDLIIPMDWENRNALIRMVRSPQDMQKIISMRTFDPQGQPTDDVPDPYYGGLDGFERVYDMVERSCKGLLSAIQTKKV